MSRGVYSGTKAHRWTCPSVLRAPKSGKRRAKSVDKGDELDARQGVDSSAHPTVGEEHRTDGGQSDTMEPARPAASTTPTRCSSGTFETAVSTPETASLTCEEEGSSERSSVPSNDSLDEAEDDRKACSDPQGADVDDNVGHALQTLPFENIDDVASTDDRAVRSEYGDGLHLWLGKRCEKSCGRAKRRVVDIAGLPNSRDSTSRARPSRK